MAQVCADCARWTEENFRQHGDEVFPSLDCRSCGKPTGIGGGRPYQVCGTCADERGVCPSCGRRPDGADPSR